MEAEKFTKSTEVQAEATDEEKNANWLLQARIWLGVKKNE